MVIMVEVVVVDMVVNQEEVVEVEEVMVHELKNQEEEEEVDLVLLKVDSEEVILIEVSLNDLVS